MSSIKVKAALESALNGMAPFLDTAWENVDYTPVVGTPFQAANVLFATPENPEFGNAHYREIGIFQITLQYPLQLGTAAILARAELIRALFKRGATFTNSGVTVTIERTPEIAPGSSDGDRWVVPVKIRFYANI